MKFSNKLLKNSGVLLLITIVIIYVVVSGFYKNINKVDSEFTNIEKEVKSIQDYILIRNNLILESKTKIAKYEVSETILDKIEKDTEEIKELNELVVNSEEINKNIDIYERSNNHVNELINMCKKNKDMKNDKELQGLITEILRPDYYVSSSIDRYNTIFRKNFNHSIKEFPLNIIANQRDIEPLDKIQNN